MTCCAPVVLFSFSFGSTRIHRGTLERLKNESYRSRRDLAKGSWRVFLFEKRSDVVNRLVEMLTGVLAREDGWHLFPDASLGPSQSSRTEAVPCLRLIMKTSHSCSWSLGYLCECRINLTMLFSNFEPQVQIVDKVTQLRRKSSCFMSLAEPLQGRSTTIISSEASPFSSMVYVCWQVGEVVMYLPQGHAAYLSTFPENNTPPYKLFKGRPAVVRCQV